MLKNLSSLISTDDMQTASYLGANRSLFCINKIKISKRTLWSGRKIVRQLMSEALYVFGESFKLSHDCLAFVCECSATDVRVVINVSKNNACNVEISNGKFVASDEVTALLKLFI